MTLLFYSLFIYIFNTYILYSFSSKVNELVSILFDYLSKKCYNYFMLIKPNKKERLVQKNVKLYITENGL
jgi:hypothetical protein